MNYYFRIDLVLVRLGARRKRCGQCTPGSLFRMAGALAFQGREEELGYFNSLVGINKFLSHVIKKVPASVGKGALKESQCNEADVGFLKSLKCILWLQPVVFSCGHKGQKAAQRDQSETWQRLALLVPSLPLSVAMIHLFVLSPVNPTYWRSGTKRRRKIQVQDPLEPGKHESNRGSDLKHSSECFFLKAKLLGRKGPGKATREGRETLELAGESGASLLGFRDAGLEPLAAF